MGGKGTPFFVPTADIKEWKDTYIVGFGVIHVNSPRSGWGFTIYSQLNPNYTQRKVVGNALPAAFRNIRGLSNTTGHHELQGFSVYLLANLESHVSDIYVGTHRSS